MIMTFLWTFPIAKQIKVYSNIFCEVLQFFYASYTKRIKKILAIKFIIAIDIKGQSWGNTMPTENKYDLLPAA